MPACFAEKQDSNVIHLKKKKYVFYLTPQGLAATCEENIRESLALCLHVSYLCHMKKEDLIFKSCQLDIFYEPYCRL